jgi:flagellar biosynthesis chaperone FliJ
MSARSWIPTVLRARQAQEDLVAQRLAVARRDAGQATDQHAEQAARIAAMQSPQLQSVPDFHASLAAHQAAAATLAAAKNRMLFAEARVSGTVSELTTAARSRRTVEKLHERHQDELDTTASGIAQRELDEVSISRHGARQRRTSE